MKPKMTELREELKELAIQIREEKAECKEYQKEHGGKSYFEYRTTARKYRHMHIAYSMLRGKTMEQIEPKHREGSLPPNVHEIDKYMEIYYDEPEKETIHFSQKRLAKQSLYGLPRGTCISSMDA